MSSKKKEYTSLVEPKIEEIVRICNENKIPFFMTFMVNDKGNSVEDFKTKTLSTSVLDVNTNDETFAKLINVMNGFETIPPQDTIEIEY